MNDLFGSSPRGNGRDRAADRACSAVKLLRLSATILPTSAAVSGLSAAVAGGVAVAGGIAAAGFNAASASPTAPFTISWTCSLVSAPLAAGGAEAAEMAVRKTGDA